MHDEEAQGLSQLRSSSQPRIDGQMGPTNTGWPETSNHRIVCCRSYKSCLCYPVWRSFDGILSHIESPTSNSLRDPCGKAYDKSVSFSPVYQPLQHRNMEQFKGGEARVAGAEGGQQQRGKGKGKRRADDAGLDSQLEDEIGGGET